MMQLTKNQKPKTIKNSDSLRWFVEKFTVRSLSASHEWGDPGIKG